MALYRWNVELSAAFFMPIQICEIALRNAAAEALDKSYGDKWVWLRGFHHTLPVLKKGNYQPAKDLAFTGSRFNTTGQVIAELKFAFWQSVFTKGQDVRVWTPHLHNVLPGISTRISASIARDTVHKEIQALRGFRNRIAHHEPIFARNIQVEYDRLYQMISWRSPVVADWMDRLQKVTEINRKRP